MKCAVCLKIRASSPPPGRTEAHCGKGLDRAAVNFAANKSRPQVWAIQGLVLLQSPSVGGAAQAIVLVWPAFLPQRSSVMSELNLSTDETRVSYGIGRQLGGQLRDNPPPGVSLDAVLAGLSDAFSGQASRVDEAELSASFKVIRDVMQAAAQAKAEEAASAGVAFLGENATREGITVLASGLQYEVLTAGEGAKPSAEDTIRAHYHGTLVDGTVFDSSYERGQPAEFPVGGVIAGWVEALQLMNTGSKWRLYVPSELAYGAQGVGSIPPHSVLVFDVELLEIL
jgi:FKBP-type peptidyl-prolyl cis-trans isomerase FklB